MAVRMAELTEIRTDEDGYRVPHTTHYADLDKDRFQIEIPSKDMN